MEYLGKCVICKKLCDTGCLIPYDDTDVERKYGEFCICLECSDNTPVAELKKIIEQKQRKFADGKYDVGDIVAFCADGTELKGTIAVVDTSGGGVYQNICTSYDIQTDNMLYKHVPEKNILTKRSI